MIRNHQLKRERVNYFSISPLTSWRTEEEHCSSFYVVCSVLTRGITGPPDYDWNDDVLADRILHGVATDDVSIAQSRTQRRVDAPLWSTWSDDAANDEKEDQNNRFGNYGDSGNLNLSTFPCRHARYKTARQPH